jgi:GxxExxY protein
LLAELKVRKEGLPIAFFRQLIEYLKFWQQPLGLLVNFAAARADIRRVLFSEKRVEPEEDYEAIRPLIATNRPLLRSIRETLLEIHRTFGLGYSDTTYRKLLAIGLRHRGIPCYDEQCVQPEFRGCELPQSPITPLNADGQVLIEVEAIQDQLTARSTRTMQTHLQFTNAAVGIVVNFGTKRFQIRGVRPRQNRAN